KNPLVLANGGIRYRAESPRRARRGCRRRQAEESIVGTSDPPRETVGRHRGLYVVSLAFAVDQKGILPDHMIAALARDGAILPAYDFVPDQIQPASLDLRLAAVAHPLPPTFLPPPAP